MCEGRISAIIIDILEHGFSWEWQWGSVENSIGKVMTNEAALGENLGGTGIRAAHYGDRVSDRADAAGHLYPRGAGSLYRGSGFADSGNRSVQPGSRPGHDAHGGLCRCRTVPTAQAGAAHGGVFCAGCPDHGGGAGSSGTGRAGQLGDGQHGPDPVRGNRCGRFLGCCHFENRFPEFPFPDPDAVLYAAVRPGPSVGGPGERSAAALGL